MIPKIFFIVLSIVLSAQSLEGFVEENTIEKTNGIEVVYQEPISSETKKQSRKLAGKYAVVLLSEERKSQHFVNEKIISQLPLYVQNRSLRI